MNISSDATPEQIKEAYRAAVRKYHPDVAESSQPDANLFRDVMEAYSVLSVAQSRTSYDIARKKNPELYGEVSEAEFNKSNRPDLRDAAGNTSIT